jgi:hypothetical protein
LAAEAGERLGELAADGSGADHGQPPRQRLEGEDGLVGEGVRLRQTGHGRHGGPRTGRDDASAEGEALAIDPDRVGRDESALPDEHVDAEVAETPDAIGLREVGPQPAHAPHGRRGVLRLVPGAPARMRAFEGTQPTLRQSPPIRCRLTSATFAPKAAEAAATTRPPGPAPPTTTW